MGDTGEVTLGEVYRKQVELSDSVRAVDAKIEALPDVWDRYAAQYGRTWRLCDGFLAGNAARVGLTPHLHRAHVLNRCL